MNDALTRTLRTFIQSFIGALATLAIPVLYDLAKAAGEADGQLVRIDVNVFGNVLIACVLAGVISVITFANNFLEEKGKLNVLPK